LLSLIGVAATARAGNLRLGVTNQANDEEVIVSESSRSSETHDDYVVSISTRSANLSLDRVCQIQFFLMTLQAADPSQSENIRHSRLAH